MAIWKDRRFPKLLVRGPVSLSSTAANDGRVQPACLCGIYHVALHATSIVER